MSDRVPINVLNAIYTGRWAIIPDSLNILVSIANRTHSDIEAVLSKPAEFCDSGNILIRDGVAILNIFGPIIPRADMFTDISGAVSIETLALRFGEALGAKDIKGIVLNIDSPGGNITNVHEFANQIYDARGTKPIIAYTGGLCASAAYWIASAADKIIADKTASIGSIGVVAAWTDDSKAREKAGLTDYAVVSSQSPNKRRDYTTKDGLAKLQVELDSLADIFIENVARNRATNSEFVYENYGKGDMMLTTEAIKVGMADDLGCLESVISDIIGNAISTKISIKSKPTLKGAVVMFNGENKRKKRAEDDPEDDEKQDGENQEDEEQNNDAKGTVDPMASLLSSDPALFSKIKQVGVVEERNRIKAIHDIGIVCGYSDAVKSAMFDNPISAADLALQIVNSEKNARVLAATNYKADAGNIPDVSASSAVDISDNKDNNLLAAMVAGFKSAGGKEVKYVV